MSNNDEDALSKAAKEALEIMNDPEKFKAFKKEFNISDEIDLITKKWREEDEAANKKFAEEHPEQVACDHGVFFDEEEYRKNPNMTAAEIQKRWPRGWGLCPKGCGYNGIAYASYFHYIAGDW